MTKGRKQYAFTVTIGWPKYEEGDVAMFQRFIISSISRANGGCTVLNGTGYWREDGAEDKPGFTGKLASEDILHIETTVEKDKEQSFLSILKGAVKFGKERYGVPCEWVHVKKTKITGLHFKV